ncbi:hypothetical protein Tco_0210991 [Tanacetum coccineum]
MQTQTSSALHNAIMEAGGKDRPPMLAPGNYAQWKSIIKRYIDTKTNHELIHFCLKNPPYQYKFLTTDANATLVTPGNEEDIQKWITVEAVLIILTGIDNDIYSTVDACPNAMEMWKEIERLKQGESINVQDLETNLYWEVYFTGSMAKQHQNEVNKIRAERLAHTANLLALVTQQQQQPVYHPQPNPTHYTQSSSTRSQAATRNRGKAIANSPPPTYDPEPKVVVDDDASSKEKKIDKLMALISNRGIGYDRQTGQYDNQRAINVVGARENVGTQEKMLPCKQEEAGIQLSAEQVDWRDDIDDEPED